MSAQLRLVTGTLFVAALFSFAHAARAAPPVVISELLWMGSSASASDEWVELANMTDAPVDLTGWTLRKLSAGSETMMLTIPSGVISAHGFFLIANDPPATSRLNVVPDLVDSAVSLVNSKLQVSLYDAAGTLVDRADDGSGSPFAGAYASGSVWKSMERNPSVGDGTSAASWHTASTPVGFDDATREFGTPGAANSNSAPTALLTAPESAFVGDAVQFDGTESSDPENDPLTYLWEFGDGQTDTLPTPVHQYAAAGTYTVTLTVRDGQRAHAAATSLVITERPPTTPDVQQQAPDEKTDGNPAPSSSAAVTLRLVALLPDPVGSDAQGEYIEIENFGPDETSCAGFRLADGATAYTLDPSEITVLLAAGGRLRVPRSVSGIALNNTGSETVTLTSSEGVMLDSVTYAGPVQEASVYARSESGWAWSGTTAHPAPETDPAAPSAAPAKPQTSTAIFLSEVLPDPDGNDAEGEYVEVANTGRATISLAGWKLVAGTREYSITNLALEPGEIVALARPATKLALNNGGGTVYLVDPFGAVLQGVRYPRAQPGEAFAWFGKRRWQWTAPTPNAANVAPQEQKTDTPTSSAKKVKTPQRVTIAALTSLPLRTLVRVEGVVTVEPGVLGDGVFYAQKGDAGIRVLGDAGVAVGDLVSLEGTVGQTEGERKITLAAADDARVLGSDDTVNASPYSPSVPGGMLVAAEGIVQKKDGSGFTLATDAGNVRVTIRPVAEIETSDYRAGDRVRVTGILRRTRPAIRLYPRSQEDVVPLGIVAGAAVETRPAVTPSAMPSTERNVQNLALLGIPLLVAAGALGWRWRRGRTFAD